MKDTENFEVMKAKMAFFKHEDELEDMKNDEFNLSEKIFDSDYDGRTPLLFVGDVKEFIRRLKEQIHSPHSHRKIDKLAGELK